ncbi:MAG: glycosyltransferase family 4 protein [Gemmatimonadetes bacterium]|nr:glycosyltransferase family 4 protein [Gemmatimonadota bacterium]
MIRCLLVGQLGGGGEEVFIRNLEASPPAGVEYEMVLEPHRSTRSARCRVFEEVAYNRVPHRLLHPLQGLRSFRVSADIDLVHVHNVLHRVRPRRVPVVTSLGGATYWHYLETYLGWTEPEIERLYRRAARILPRLGIGNEFVNPSASLGFMVFSRFAASHLLRWGVPGERVEVIPPGVPTPADAPRLRRERGGRGPLTFLLVGRHPERKGADLVLQAFRSLRRRHDVRLVLCGDPAYGDLDEPGVETHPWIDRERLLHEIFPAADVFLLPSRAEGYGLALVEAMAYGIPGVATLQGAFPEILDDGRCGLLVAPADAGALESAMESLLLDDELRASLGTRARRRYEEEHAMGVFRERVAAFYRRAMARA